MKPYIGIVHQEGDSAFGIHFPDIPGCFSAADDLDDLLRHASQALALHLEDMPAPQPRTLDALRADREIQAELAAGAFLMAIPFIKLTGRTQKANITLDAGLLQLIDQTARERGLTRSAFLSDVARREITG
tara:strand:+ start:1921 stop:2313 length:393 start_codon:yes stop_codon:yes gene_type:complete